MINCLIMPTIDVPPRLCYHRTHVLSPMIEPECLPMIELITASDAVLAHLDELAAAAEQLLDTSLSANTRRAYQSDWRLYCA